MSEMVKAWVLGIQRLDFAEADRGQGDDGHVQRVQHTPALGHPVADDAIDRHAEQEQEREPEPDQEPVPCRRPGDQQAASVNPAHRHGPVGSGRRP
jgi:hypothetical protein